MTDQREDYTLILNFYNKSIELLRHQCDLIKLQSHKPVLVIACFLGDNTGHLFLEFMKYIKEHELTNWKWVFSNHNFKYIGRYQIALNIPTDYVVMLDDDRQPDTLYCEEMVEFAHKNNAIVQQYGWALRELEIDGEMMYKDGHGDYIWPLISKEDYDKLRGDKEYVEVSYLCGGMTFHKKHLKYLFNEPLLTDQTGEDIILCRKAALDGVLVAGYIPWYIGKSESTFLGHDPGGVTSTTVDVKENQDKRNELLNIYK